MDNFTEIEIYLKNQVDILEVKNIVPEIKDSLAKYNSRLYTKENRINELKYK